MDEINTCSHLGLINDVLCHRSYMSQPLPHNLTFLGACNPYKLKAETPKRPLAGLEPPKDIANKVCDDSFFSL